MSDAAKEITSRDLPGQRPRFQVVSHSTHFYWWPVWSLGFVMAAISFVGSDRLAIVPEGTKVITLESRPNP